MDRSPCLKCKQLLENKLECSEGCLDLAAFQDHLLKVHDFLSSQGIDYSEDEWGGLIPEERYELGMF